MLGVLLLILKIIGFILASLIALILLLVLVVLLVPVRYRGRGSFYGKPEGVIGISWLLHLISVRISFREKLEVTVRVLGFRLFKEKGEAAEEDLIEEPVLSAQEFAEDVFDTAAEGEAESVPETGVENEPETDAVGESEPDVEEELEADAEGESKPVKENEPEADVVDESESAVEHEPSVESEPMSSEFLQPAEGGKKSSRNQRRKRRGGRKNLFLKLYKSIKKRIRRLALSLKLISKRIKVLWLKKERLMAFIRDEENQKTFRLVKKQMKTLIRHVRPRKIKGELTFGLEDPYLMGQCLSGAALFYPMYHKSLNLAPRFDEKILEGKLFLKGRIRLGTLLVIGLRLLIHKNFRVLLKRFLSQGGNYNGR